MRHNVFDWLGKFLCSASLVRSKPQPPQNCTVTQQTETYITVHCLEPQFNDDPPSTYFLQVYDATTRMLLGSATSETPELTFYTTPKRHNGLQLFVRSMNSKSMTSDAAVILTPPADLRIRKGGKGKKGDGCLLRWWELITSFLWK